MPQAGRYAADSGVISPTIPETGRLLAHPPPASQPRVREESRQLGTRRGTLGGLTVTGGVITAAGVILAATFAALAQLPSVSVTEVGTAVAIGVLLDTLLVRTVLVPALLITIGDRIWWPGRAGPPTKPQAS